MEQHIGLLDDLEGLRLPGGVHEAKQLCILYCTGGDVSARVNLSEVQLRRGDLFVCMPRYRIEEVRTGHRFRCRMMLVDQVAFGEMKQGYFKASSRWYETLRYVEHYPVVHLSERRQEMFDCYFALLRTYLDDEDAAYSRTMTAMVAQAMVFEWTRCLEELIDCSRVCSDIPHQTDLLLQRFFLLLQKHVCEQREVRWYAERLNVSAKHLTQMCTKYTGSSAMACISAMAEREIKWNLISSEKSVKEIAFDMGFADLSSFARYVKKHLGASPNEYRRQHRKEIAGR